MHVCVCVYVCTYAVGEFRIQHMCVCACTIEKLYDPFSLYDRTTEAISVLDMPFYGTVSIVVPSVLRYQR